MDRRAGTGVWSAGDRLGAMVPTLPGADSGHWSGREGDGAGWTDRARGLLGKGLVAEGVPV